MTNSPQELPHVHAFPFEQIIKFVSICIAFVFAWCFLFTLGYIGLYYEFPLEFFFFINYASLSSAAFPTALLIVTIFIILFVREQISEKPERLHDVLLLVIVTLILMKCVFLLPNEIGKILNEVKNINGSITEKQNFNYKIFPALCLGLFFICLVYEVITQNKKTNINDWGIISKLLIIILFIFIPIFEGEVYALKKRYSHFISCIKLKQGKTNQGIIIYTNQIGILIYESSFNTISFYYSDEISKVIYNCGKNQGPFPKTLPIDF